MRPQEYSAVAAACDQLLQAPDAGVERLAVPLLHVLKEHPSWLRQYEPALRASAAGGPKSPLRSAASAAKAAAGALWRSAQQTASDMLQRESRAPVQVLIVSHLTSPAQCLAQTTRLCWAG